ncbi:unnamed protein product [Durusdinium trenchii]
MRETKVRHPLAAARNGHLEVARLLLEAGADPNAKDHCEAPALIAAAQNGHLEVVRLLLKAAADTNATDRQGATALMTAARNGYLEVLLVAQRGLFSLSQEESTAKWQVFHL